MNQYSELIDTLERHSTQCPTNVVLNAVEAINTLTKQRNELMDLITNFIADAKLTDSQYELCRQALSETNAYVIF